MINNSKTFTAVAVVVFLSVFFLNISTLMAEAFPFRGFNEDDPVPDVTLRGYQDAGKSVTFSSLQGKPFIAIFWGADLPEKREHAANVLKEVHSLFDFLKERNVQLLSVNAQGDDDANIDEVIRKSGSDIDVYVDPGQKAYATLGIFVMPTVLVVDKDGKASAALGYSHDLQERLKGAVEIMLGEKTPEQVEAELRPEMKEASDQQKGSRRHFDFGMVMLKRGQIDAAIREFAKAVEIDPTMSVAQLQLGCLYLDKNELENAEQAIEKAIAEDPDLLRARICRGELKRQKGMLDDAVQELKNVLAKEPNNFEALYYLGRVYEDQKLAREAAEAYRKAYTLVLKHSVAGE